MPNEELDQQDKQEQKEDDKKKRKQTLKVAITSSICTLLLVIIILLLVILGLKKCGPTTDKGSALNVNTSSQYVEIYDNKTLNNVFKTIVKEQRKIDAEENIVPKDIIAVTYSTLNNKFNLSITMTTEDNKIFFYSVTN